MTDLLNTYEKSFRKLKFRQISKIGCKLGATFGELLYLCTQLNE